MRFFLTILMNSASLVLDKQVIMVQKQGQWGHTKKTTRFHDCSETLSLLMRKSIISPVGTLVRTVGHVEFFVL